MTANAKEMHSNKYNQTRYLNMKITSNFHKEKIHWNELNKSRRKNVSLLSNKTLLLPQFKQNSVHFQRNLFPYNTKIKMNLEWVTICAKLINIHTTPMASLLRNGYIIELRGGVKIQYYVLLYNTLPCRFRSTDRSAPTPNDPMQVERRRSSVKSQLTPRFDNKYKETWL